MLLPLAVRAGALAALVAVAAYHAVRLRSFRRRAAETALDVTHLAMAAVMIAMLTGRTDARTSAWAALAFAVPAVWLVVRAVRDYVLDGIVGSPATQAAGCCGMVAVLALSAASSTSMTGMSMAARAPAGPAVLLLLAMTAATATAVAALRRRTGRDLIAGGCRVLMAGTTTLMAAALL